MAKKTYPVAQSQPLADAPPGGVSHVLRTDGTWKDIPEILVEITDDGRLKPVVPEAQRTVLCRIEYYLDPEPTEPTAFRYFTERLKSLSQEVRDGWWRTVAFDSLTYFELNARKYDQYVTNKKSREPRQWYASSTSAIEENIMMRFGAYPCNVVVIAHVNSDRDSSGGVRIYMPDAPGKMPKKLPAGFSEVYRTWTKKDTETQKTLYLLQTESDADYIAATRIHAPDPSWPTYADLWTGTKYAALAEKPPIHALLYGEPGTGKSTMAATFAYGGPMLVLMFDPFGKDMAYLELGDPGPLVTDGPVPYRDIYEAT